MSSRLTYGITETPFREDIRESVRRVFNKEIGNSTVYRVIGYLKTTHGWTNPFRMIYDTGAVVSLLPLRFYRLLEVEKYAPITLMGVSPDVRLKAGLTRATVKLEDTNTNVSPDIELWIAIAERDDVPAVLGLKDFSEFHELTVDPKKNTFSLNFY